MRAGSSSPIIVGDRMDTDIIAGMESGLETVLVLSGVARERDIGRYSYRPDHVLASVAGIPKDPSFWP